MEWAKNNDYRTTAYQRKNVPSLDPVLNDDDHKKIEKRIRVFSVRNDAKLQAKLLINDFEVIWN